MTYATLAEAKQELKAGTASNTVEDAKLYTHIRTVSARLDLEFSQRRPFFAPYIESRQVRITPANINSYDNVLYINQNLLALTSVTVNGTALTVGTTVEAWPTLASPFRALRLMDVTNDWYNYCSSTYAPLFATINGVWGFHRDYPNAWLSVDTLAAAIVSASATTFTVADVDGSDPYGRTPRISAGNWLKIDDEYLEVVSTDTATNTVTVRRGVNGSTAATHAISSAVSVWQVEEPVKRANARQAAFLYARQGAFESSVITDIGTLNYPSDWLGEVKRIIQEYSYQ